MICITDGNSPTIEIIRKPLVYISVRLGEVDPAIGGPAERRYRERKVALERQLEAVYRKIGQTDKQINRLKQRPEFNFDDRPKPALTALTKQNSEPDMLQYILALRHSINQKIIIRDDDGFPREVRLGQYDEEINNLEIPTSVALDYIWNRTLKQEDYNNMINGTFRLRNEKEISTQCLGEYLDNFPKASDFGLTEVTGDQTDPNVSNPSEERPSILFPNAEEYKVEMKLLREGIEGRCKDK